MIRKLNIVLLVVMVIMFGVKYVRDMDSGSASNVDAIPVAAEGDSRSELEPHIYYDNWPPFACRNEISGRYGFILDQLRAIFPRAKFICHEEEYDEKWKRECLDRDPLAVIPTMGDDIPGFEVFRRAPTPLGWNELRLVTLRMNPWTYSGTNSLESLRIVAHRLFVDCAQTRDLERRGILKIVPVARLDGLDVLKNGEADAILTCCSSDLASDTESSTGYDVEECRYSAPIGRSYVYFRVSTNDAAVAEALVHDYETGMKRIRENGVRRRICEYYGFME